MSRIAQVLERIAGAGSVQVLPTGAVCVRPKDRLVLQEIVRQASEDHAGMVLSGGGLELRERVRGADAPNTFRIDLRGLDRVVEHGREDLFLRVEAGATIAKAARTLIPHDQEFGFLAAQEEVATVGGVFARGRETAWRKARGALRDQVLGVEILLADGRLVRSGGQVVKNVSGYDLSRLMIGARGALGILTELTLKVHPRPALSDTVLLPYPSLADALAAGTSIRERGLEVFALHLVAGDLVLNLDAPSPAAVLATLRGSPALIEALARELIELHTGKLEPLRLDTCLDTLLANPVPNGAAHLGLAVQRGRLRPLFEEIRTLLPAEDGSPGRRLVADLETGIVHLGLGEGWTLDEEGELALGERLQALEAWCDLPRDPRFYERRFRNFPSTAPRSASLEREIKRAFDPKMLFNPGRHEVLR